METWAPAFLFMLLELFNKKYDDTEESATDDYVMKMNLANFKASQANTLPQTKLEGQVTTVIMIRNHGEYLKWKQYFDPGRKWEIVTAYPVNMRIVRKFKTAQDVQMITNEIVSLLQLGFRVYSANWKLKEEQSNDVAVEEKEEE